jgi:RNA polymerase sigma-19 factor, ECF subfamily
MRSCLEYGDMELIELIKHDDSHAYKQVFERYWEKLFAFVYNHLHDREVSREIVQEVFVTLWAKRKELQIVSSISAYLFSACKYRMLNEIRSGKVRQKYAADFEQFVKQTFDNSNEEQQDLIDLENAISKSIASLPEKCQIIFRMSREEHLPIKNIAQQMNITTKTVENHITHALRHLRTSLSHFMSWAVISLIDIFSL